MYVFISHSSYDTQVACDACDILEKNGIKCFLAPRDIRSGHEYAEEIVDGIDRSDAVILLLSKKSNESPHVLREIERSVSRSIPIIVYKLEDVELRKSMEYFLMTHQWVNAKQGAKMTDLVKCVDMLSDRSENKAVADSDEKIDDCGENAQVKKRNRIQKRISVPAAIVCGILLVGILIWVLAGHGMEKEADVLGVKAGDTVVFGSYNGEPIEWRVLKVSDDGGEAVLISKYILTMKAYDAPESGKYNYDGGKDYWSDNSTISSDMELQARVRGNNDWSNSTIRTWLNSSEEVVRYNGQDPTAAAMSEHKNGYSNEPGFLYGFTKEELEALKTVSVSTRANVLAVREGDEADNAGNILTHDSVYLLSAEELDWFEEAGMSKLAVPTEAALQQDESGWYRIYSLDYGVDEYFWWLREPVDNSSSKCFLVGNGYSDRDLFEYSVGLEGFGIRPAVTVDLHVNSVKQYIP